MENVVKKANENKIFFQLHKRKCILSNFILYFTCKRPTSFGFTTKIATHNVDNDNSENIHKFSFAIKYLTTTP